MFICVINNYSLHLILKKICPHKRLLGQNQSGFLLYLVMNLRDQKCYFKTLWVKLLDCKI
jgi:hypothetical protein